MRKAHSILTSTGDSPRGKGWQQRRQILPSNGFSLVEVTISMGIASFCLLSILGLLMTGMTSGKSTVGQTIASNLLSIVYSDIVSTATDSGVSKTFGISLQGTGNGQPQTLYFSEGGKATGPIGSNPVATSIYRVSIGVQSPTSSLSPTIVRIMVTWPAAADSDPARWPANPAGLVEVVTALNRY